MSVRAVRFAWKCNAGFAAEAEASQVVVELAISYAQSDLDTPYVA